MSSCRQIEFIEFMQTPLPLLRSTEGAQHHKVMGLVFKWRSATCLGQYEMALASSELWGVWNVKQPQWRKRESPRCAALQSMLKAVLTGVKLQARLQGKITVIKVTRVFLIQSLGQPKIIRFIPQSIN